MMLLTAQQRLKLAENGQDCETDHVPVVKLFTPWANATWLLKDMLPDGDTCFGLCDLGLGEPELGYVSLKELEKLRGPAGLRVERDLHFETELPLSRWTKVARIAGRIITPD
ncbi:DUF2958 domain-containing protein [Brucella sp. C7-11G]